MSRQELVDAFLDGQISRRTLIRRLIAGGVSVGAAISYAQLLAPEPAAGAVRRGAADAQYPLVDLAITSPSLASVRNNAAIKVTLISTEELRRGRFRAFLKTPGGGGFPINQPNVAKFVDPVIKQAGTRSVSLPIDASQLTGLSSARFYIQMTAEDAERFPALASTGKTLS